MSVTLVLGGARSGKSAFALAEAERSLGDLVMIATAEALDADMAERIARHRAERGGRWRTIEAPLDIGDAIRSLDPGATVVLDCLTLWVSNLMFAERSLEEACEDLLDALAGPAELILVANEVGLGIVPDNALARRFRDEAGRLNQRIAKRADAVVLLVAGIPVDVKRRP